MSADRHLAFATTQPDVERVSARFRRPAVLDMEPVPERESQIRIKESNSPLSAELKALATDLRGLASAMFAARMEGDAEAVLGLYQEATLRIGMAAHGLTVHAHTADVFERELIARMRGDQ